MERASPSEPKAEPGAAGTAKAYRHTSPLFEQIAFESSTFSVVPKKNRKPLDIVLRDEDVMNASDPRKIRHAPYDMHFSARIQAVNKGSENFRWRIGYIQVVEKDHLEWLYGQKDEPVNHIKLDSPGPLLDQPGGGAGSWYDRPKIPFRRLSRQFATSDAPSSAGFLVHEVGNSTELLLGMGQRVTFKTYLAATRKGSGNVFSLKSVRWSLESKADFRDAASLKGVNYDDPKVSEPAPKILSIEEKLFKVLGDLPKQTHENWLKRINGGETVARGDIIEKEAEEATQSEPVVPPGLDPLMESEVRPAEEERDPEDLARLKEEIKKYRNCRGTVSPACFNGEIVMDPSEDRCVLNAPCGVMDCVREHELRHAADYKAELVAKGLDPKANVCKAANAMEDTVLGMHHIDGLEPHTCAYLAGMERRGFKREIECYTHKLASELRPDCRRLLRFMRAEARWRLLQAAFGILKGQGCVLGMGKWVPRKKKAKGKQAKSTEKG